MESADVAFTILSVVAIAASIGVAGVARDTVSAGWCLLVTAMSLAGISVLLGAAALAIAQVLVFGAIGVALLIHAGMLGAPARSREPRPRRMGPTLLRVGGALALGALALHLASLVGSLQGALQSAGVSAEATPPGYGGLPEVGARLFSDGAVPVTGITLVLLAAVVGAIVLVTRRAE